MFSALPGRWLTLAFGLLALALCLGNLVLLAGATYALIVVLVGLALVAPNRIVVRREYAAPCLLGRRGAGRRPAG